MVPRPGFSLYLSYMEKLNAFSFFQGPFFYPFLGNCFSCSLLFFLHDFCASVSQLLKVLCILEPFTFYL